MDFGIKGKTALVTASSKGLGRASALALAEEGANRVICARTIDALHKTADDIKRLGVDVLVIPGDITEAGTPKHLVERAVEHFGSLDILVANAGGPPGVSAFDVTEENLSNAINNNLTTSMRLVMEGAPHMRTKNWGRICLITSRTVKEPLPSNSLSNIARTGLWAWAKTAASELFEQGITLNTACPGLHATDRLKELGIGDNEQLGDPEDFGAVVAFLCSQQAGFINGTSLVVDGGSIAAL